MPAATRTPLGTPTATYTTNPVPSCRPGDADGNQVVDFFDLRVISYKQGYAMSRGDADCSGLVDATDYAVTLARWGADYRPTPTPWIRDSGTLSAPHLTSPVKPGRDI